MENLTLELKRARQPTKTPEIHLVPNCWLSGRQETASQREKRVSAFCFKTHTCSPLQGLTSRVRTDSTRHRNSWNDPIYVFLWSFKGKICAAQRCLITFKWGACKQKSGCNDCGQKAQSLQAGQLTLKLQIDSLVGPSGRFTENKQTNKAEKETATGDQLAAATGTRWVTAGQKVSTIWWKQTFRPLKRSKCLMS